MKAYLVSVLIVDHDELGPQGVRRTLENARYPNRCIFPQVHQLQEFDVGEWDDNHPLNQRGVDIEAHLTSTLMPKN